MKEKIFKYSHVAAWVVAILFAIGLAVRLLIPASSSKGVILNLVNMGVTIAMLVYFANLCGSTSKGSPIHTPAILGIVAYSIFTLVMLFVITGKLGAWLKVVYCALIIIALIRMCKFFQKGSRIKVAAIILMILFTLLPIILLLLGMIRSMAAESIVQYGFINGSLAPQTERLMRTMVIFVQIEVYMQFAHNLIAAWFLYEFSHLNKQ